MKWPGPVLVFLLQSGLLLSLLAGQAGCLFFRGQRYHHFITRTPMPPGHTLILGFMGGRERWNHPHRGVRKLALKLRSMNLPKVQIETVENKKRELALRLIRNAFDRNRDGQLGAEEKEAVRLILYGQSFGGAAVVKLARQLDRRGIPVLLTVQVDSVGRGDGVIPANVRRAANLFQRNGLFIRGEAPIRPRDPARTEILANREFDYSNRKIDLSRVSWFKRLFRTAHTKMDLDPEVWQAVEDFILGELKR